MSSSIRFSQVWRFVLLVAIASLLYTILTGSEETNPRRGRHLRRPKFSSRPTRRSAMAATYLEAIASRRTIYGLTKESTISNTRIREILTETIKHSPSSFNNQAQRAVLLIGGEHDQLWNIVDEHIKTNLPQAYDGLKDKVVGYKNGYGSVLFFEDAETLKPFKETHPEFPFDQWADHSQGMLQIHTWDAFELEGLGANLQHYNFLPGLQDKIRAQWKLPGTWDLRAQLVFGKPAGQPMQKTYDQVEGKRLLIFGDN